MDYDFDVSRPQLYCVLYDPIKTPVLSYVGGALPDRLVNMAGTTTMAGQMCIRSLGGQNGDTVVYTAGQTSDPAVVWGLTATAGYTPGAAVLLGPVKMAFDEQGPVPPLPTPGPSNLTKCQSAYAQGFGDGQSKAAPQSNTWGDPMAFQCYFCGYNDGFNGRTKRTVGSSGGGGGGNGGGRYPGGVSPSYPPGTWPPPDGAIIDDPATGGGSPGVVGGVPGIPVSWLVTATGRQIMRQEIADQGALNNLGLTAPNWSDTNLVVTTAQLESLTLGAPLYGATMNGPQGPPYPRHGGGGGRNGGGGNGYGGGVNTLLTGVLPQLLNGLEGQASAAEQPAAAQASQSAQAAADAAQGSAQSAAAAAQQAQAALQQQQQQVQQQQQPPPPAAAASRLPLVLGLSAVGLALLAAGWAIFRKKPAPVVAPVKEPRS